eukprot:scaffold24487_cov39-Cyclotella_meneghiniana.AAC.2
MSDDGAVGSRNYAMVDLKTGEAIGDLRTLVLTADDGEWKRVLCVVAVCRLLIDAKRAGKINLGGSMRVYYGLFSKE